MEDISDICFNILYSLSFSIADTSFLGPERTGGRWYHSNLCYCLNLAACHFSVTDTVLVIETIR